MTITVQPDVLTAGGQATVSVQGSSRGGQTITVEADNGEGDTESIQITLDEHGNGSAAWTVPSWESASFNYSSCAEVARAIQEPESNEDPP